MDFSLQRGAGRDSGAGAREEDNLERDTNAEAQSGRHGPGRCRAGLPESLWARSGHWDHGSRNGAWRAGPGGVRPSPTFVARAPARGAIARVRQRGPEAKVGRSGREARWGSPPRWRRWTASIRRPPSTARPRPRAAERAGGALSGVKTACRAARAISCSSQATVTGAGPTEGRRGAGVLVEPS